MQNIPILREVWLTEANALLDEHMKQKGIRSPEVRVSCGWPSRGGLNKRSRVIGQCFAPEICADGKAQLFISPILSDEVEVLGTLLHEKVHAAVGCIHGHKKPFSQAARVVGLAGKPTATTVGDQLRPVLLDYLAQIGPYPHSAINPDGRGKDALVPATEEEVTRISSRLRLFECGCQPPVKVRVAHDVFQAQCLICTEAFHRV